MTAQTVTTRCLALARRTSVVVLLAASAVMLAGPAGADVPEGWSDPEEVNDLEALLIMVGLPLALGLVITILTYLPALVRGERIAPGAPEVESQWFGGPRKGTAELAAPDTDQSQAGGSSARW